MITITLLLLLIKHQLADLWLQAMYVKPSNKLNLLDERAHRHYTHHAMLTFVIILMLWDWKTALLLMVYDYLTHWVIDWSQTALQKTFNTVPDTHVYWLLKVLDQSCHVLVYFSMIYIIQHV